MENIDLAKTSEPPHYPHEFEAPVSYGYFPTMWRPWPGAESVPGNTARPQEEEVQQGTADTTEPLPEPSNESAPGSDLGPGMENVFDLPPNADQGMPGEQPEGMRQEEPSEAPDTTLPDELIPPESEAVPADESAAPAAEPAGEVMPDELIPPDEGQEASPKTTKFRGNWDLESLPSDAPEGTLIPDAPVPDAPATVVAKPLRPDLLTPDDKPRRSPARALATNRERPAAIAEARRKATLGEPENCASRIVLRQKSAVGNDHRNRPGRTATDRTADAADAAPQVASAANPAENHATVATSRPTDSRQWMAARPAGQRPPAAVTVADGEPAPTDWRTRGTRRASQPRSIAQSNSGPSNVTTSQADNGPDGWKPRTAKRPIRLCKPLTRNPRRNQTPARWNTLRVARPIRCGKSARQKLANAAALVEFQLCSGISP